MYPGEFALDWTNYNHRRSLVRVVKQLEKLSILAVVEGEVERFAMNEEQEVLYETTVYARYFMRSYPDDLFAYDSLNAILESEWERHTADKRRKRVYRKLLTSPVVYREGEDDPDFAYIRNFRNRLRDDLESHTPFRMEIFKNAALLVAEERTQDLTLFPDQKAIMDVALHVAAYIRENGTHYPPDEFGRIRLTRVTFEHIVKDVHAIYGKGWSKAYREKTPISGITNELINLLEGWEMLDKAPLTDAYIIKPLFGRIYGRYPDDFLEREELPYEQSD